MTSSNRLAVIGGGSWGTALANAAAAAGRDVVLWMRDAEAAERMQASRENARYLPGIRLHENVRASVDAADLGDAGCTLMVTPAQTMRGVLADLGPSLAKGAPVVLCAKGIERGSDAFMSAIAEESLPGVPVAVLSGPSFAVDVARGLPTAVTLACADGVVAARLAGLLSGPAFRLYHTDDVRGVEIGGAGKNVLAIASGIVAGRGLGESARAALIARAFAELMRFARAYGGRAETLMGLSGLGDLVLTASSPQSRNFAFGERLGRGASPDEASGGKLAEGAFTAAALLALARAKGVEMPVAEAVAAVVSGEASVEGMVARLLARPLKGESVTVTAGPIHAFLAGTGRDGSGRLLEDVLAFDDARVEGVHDFIQWCFPLREASRAVPGAPVLSAEEAEAIRADSDARAGLRAALERMTRFYAETDGWLRPYDHNHLRVTRIITAVRDLIGRPEAESFHDFVSERNEEAGVPVNRGSLTFWRTALAG